MSKRYFESTFKCEISYFLYTLVEWFGAKKIVAYCPINLKLDHANVSITVYLTAQTLFYKVLFEFHNDFVNFGLCRHDVTRD